MNPEVWSPSLQRVMRDSDREAVLRLYELGAASADVTGQTLFGHAELRSVLE